jgi:long-chain acyl-CoA synthetase
VFGVPDERLGEVPAAVIYSEAAGIDRDGLAEFLGPQLASYKLPVFVWLHDGPLPKLGTGKIDKVELRKRYRNLVAQQVA